ncbi:MAG: acyl-CoA thioesterase [Bacteroidetes bacterium]|nr:acyl-CoA thioesterase [Bacteroidota bacterium]
MADSTKEYPISIPLNVQWGEMDAFNHVNNTVYFKYFEIARINFMENSGMLALMEAEKVGPILAHIEASFRIPLSYPDTIKACARVKSIGNTSFVIEHMVWSKNHNAVACIGDGVVVMLDYKTGEKVKISDVLRNKLESLRSISEL